MKKILVTGGAGFIGHHLTRRLLSMGMSVVCIDKDISRLNKDSSDKLMLIQADLLEYEGLGKLVKDSDYVIHLAALVGVQNGLDYPQETMTNNLFLTIMVAELCEKYGVEMFFASTSEIYGVNPEMPLSEESHRVVGPSWKARWAYSDSKAIAERILISRANGGSLKLKVGRLFNTVGPGQSGRYGMVMPRFIGWAATNESLRVYGSGSQTRSFSHISDTIDGILTVIESGQNAEVYNIGNSEEVSINSLAQRVIERTHSFSNVTYTEYTDVHPEYEDIERRVPDTAKLQALGWSPSYNLNNIIDDIFVSDWIEA